ncbi:glycosyltransferase family 39 protein [Acidobacteria bacterium ACD]|nr:MAG: glycosyltransferase family 39 protein [Acidobacteriota bacterium]MDL1950779.1 glycosyltransferase family 39 protein [Acidobacteria bacterium ACD]
MTWRPALLLAGTVLAALLLLAPRTTLWDRDEPRYAQAAVEMVRSGDLLVPTFNGGLRAKKPVLVTWLMAASVGLLGPTELAVRAFSAAGIAGAVFLTALAGARLLGPGAGLLSGAVLATSPLVVLQGLAATTDAVLLAFVTLSIALVARNLARGPSAGRTAALGLALGGALLAKGPVGLAVPVLVAGGALALLPSVAGGRRAQVRSLLLVSLLGLALFAAWFLPANAATRGRFLEIGLGREVLHRAATPMEGHGGGFLLSLPYYLPVLLAGLFPWSVHLPAALLAAVRRRREGELSAGLLLAWAVAPLVLFTLVATKLPHYVLPCFPALALLVGWFLERARRGELSPSEERWLVRGAWGGAAVSALLLAALLVAFERLPVPGARAPLVAMALLVVASAPAALVLSVRRSFAAAVWVLLAGTASVEAVAAGWLAPSLEAVKPVPRIAAAIRAATPRGVPVASVGFGEPSLVFYAGRLPVAQLPDMESAAVWARRPGPGVLVASREALDALLARPDAPRLRLFARESGIDVVRMRPLELVALHRNP